MAREGAGVDADDFFDRPPYKQFRGDQLSRWQRLLGRNFEIGTLYTVIAGMLNLLVVLDAFAGPLHPAVEPGTDQPAGAAGRAAGKGRRSPD